LDIKLKARYEALSRVIKALSHPTRLLIVEELSRSRYCVCELTEMVGADTSTVSKHLSILKNAGLIKDHKVGASVYYELLTPCVLDFIGCIEDVIKETAEKQLEATGIVTV